MAKRGRPAKLIFGYLAATAPLSVPDVNWGGRFDGSETVSVPKPDTDVKLLTVELSPKQIEIESRLDKLVAENPHWGRLR
tara:strand:+ start:183 stop:422 length:240 start_codon:yes stop_codon:yes gene_type:complete